MQRSRAAVNVEVKQVIGSLCKLLAATGLDAVPAPEAFRRAKFSGGVEENQFWQLLSSILHTTGVVHSEAGALPKGASEHRKLVAAGLWQTGYYAEWMYGREHGGQEGRNLSSKDLLLALGWLLATGTLEKLLAQRVQQLDKTLLTSLPVNTQVCHGLQFDSASLRRLQWLIGSLRHQGRILLSMLGERTRLLHAVLSASLSSAVPSSSDQSSTALDDDCVRMRQLCDLLEAYVNWKQVEKVFWTWMDSVVECRLSEPVVNKPSHTPNVSARMCHQGNQALEKLEDVLSKLPTAQKAQRTGKEDAEDRGTQMQDRLDTTSLALLFSPLPLPSLSQACRARLQADRPVRHNRHQAEGLHDRAKAEQELQPSEAVRVLLQTEAQLLQRRNQQRLANRMMLQDIIGKLDELVLIPP
ncbi:tubulin epsilon and delta complex protein 1 isoform X2 [Anabas testudineus]|uniref:tubulin epsilon and delta complex protein 1 isoform X2 n=1 Tax=Anabas testudineus TaxID=64144 RepID=UPI000E45ABBE|nr:tubulin epsilon and delta complex protein 1 isoform X2 [Anabas testudineus]